jgi:hypothetical protein
VTITLKIESNWLKVNDQKLTKVTTPPVAPVASKEEKEKPKDLTKDNLDKVKKIPTPKFFPYPPNVFSCHPKNFFQQIHINFFPPKSNTFSSKLSL